MKVIDSRNEVIAEGTSEYCNKVIELSKTHPKDVKHLDKPLYEYFTDGHGWAGTLNVIE